MSGRSRWFGRGSVRSVLVSVAIFAILLNACPSFALTHEEERKMGRKIYGMIKKQADFVEDSSVTEYVNGLGRKILQAVGPQPFEFKFTVVDHGAINAFATPGGYIYVYSGLIGALDSEGELVAILSHEVAHVTSRHISNRVKKSRNLNIAALAGMVAGALLGGPIGSAVIMGAMGGAVQAQLGYSREDEREADMKGLEYMVQAGYDPRFMANSFKVLQKSSWRTPADYPNYLKTHPGLPERISVVEGMVATHPAYGQVLGRGDQKAYLAVKNKILAITGEPNSVRNHFQNIINQYPNSPAGYYGLGLVYQREQKYTMAVQAFEKALQIQPANANILTDLGMVLFESKDFQGAMSALSKAIVLRPNATRTLFMLGRTYEEMGVIPRAHELYQRTLIQDPNHAEALYRMGVFYGRLGDMPRAHLHTGLYFKSKDEPEKALFHLNKANDMAAVAPPDVRVRIKKAIEQAEKDKKDMKDEEKQG